MAGMKRSSSVKAPLAKAGIALTRVSGKLSPSRNPERMPPCSMCRAC